MRIFRTFFTKYLPLIFIGLIICSITAAFSSCNQSGETEHAEEVPDPLPGDLVRQTLLEDSLLQARSSEVKQNMEKVIKDYQQRFRNETYSGYFTTDLNADGMPELWVKIGSFRDNSKLELYYPLPDGSLQKSETRAEPGHYYLADGHLIQVVGAGPGMMNVNNIRIHNGTMDVENIRQIDFFSNPKAQPPRFSEPEIRSSSLSNLTPLNNAFPH